MVYLSQIGLTNSHKHTWNNLTQDAETKISRLQDLAKKHTLFIAYDNYNEGQKEFSKRFGEKEKRIDATYVLIQVIKDTIEIPAPPPEPTTLDNFYVSSDDFNFLHSELESIFKEKLNLQSKEERKYGN